ncbi:MAG: hypothetical protein COB59_03375 [Rhodospirillaceae bacterium]|nr:MAG: hypothetical protein COB59_03375 [Rhodospirillaceae bacterium]
MKKLMILVAVFFLLAGGTVGVLKYMQVGPFKVDPALMTEEDKAKTLMEEAQAVLKARPHYVEMDPIQIPIFQGDGVAGTVLIHYKMEALSIDNQLIIAKAKRQIGDALIQDFSYYLPRTLRNNKTLDVTLIKYRIVMIASKLLGKGVVNDALIQSMTSTDQ